MSNKKEEKDVYLNDIEIQLQHQSPDNHNQSS